MAFTYTEEEYQQEAAKKKPKKKAAKRDENGRYVKKEDTITPGEE